MRCIHAARRMIASDLFRYRGATGPRDFIFAYLMFPGFRYCIFLRLFGEFAHDGPLRRQSRTHFEWLMRSGAVWWLRHYEYKYGIHIPIETQIGDGLYIGHHGGITVTGDASIGANCNLSHNVTIGTSSRGVNRGDPVIGDRVFIGPGAVIFGKVRVGNDVAVGANSVVVEDVPDGAVVAGVPARIVGRAGSAGYAIRLWRDRER
jgi:serine O-acetyltransferase